MSIRVLLVDDESLVRAGFRLILESEADIEVIEECANGEEAVAAAQSLDPDVILMDVQMPVRDGIAATRDIVALGRTESSRVVILTTFDLDEYVFDAIRAGASGFLVKHTEPDELLRAVRAVVSGGALMSPGVTRRLIDEFASRSREPTIKASVDGLTEREREVVALVGEGLTNDEIAERLIMSTATAKTHVSRAMTKLRVRDRAQLVVLAYESGLVRPGWA